MKRTLALTHAGIAVLFLVLPCRAADDPLPSWNEGPAKQSIIRFVQAVTDRDGANYVPPDERIAVFDNDGTLLTEQPAYVQYIFTMERVQALAPQHPDWSERPLFKSAIEGDLEAVTAAGVSGMLEMLAVAHAGLTTEQFQGVVTDWFATARHPRFDRAYNTLIFQPMLEVLAYLRANRFKTWIVSGSSVELLRPWTMKAYGIPPEQVIGSVTRRAFELREEGGVLVRSADMEFHNDRENKPLAIERHIGRRPIAAFGNSDGDLPMIQWTTSGSGARFGLIVHHDDAEREYAYDRESHAGRLDKGLQEVPRRGWTLVSMRKDWKAIYPSAN